MVLWCVAVGIVPGQEHLVPSLCCSQVCLCSYREVFKAKHRQTGKKVALKKVLMENEKEGVSV